MNEKQFSELIRRCLSGEASEEEASQVERWLNSRASQDRFSQFPIDEKGKIKAAIFSRLSSRITDGSGLSERRHLSVRPKAFYQIAAAIILLCLFSYTLLNFKRNPVEEKISIMHSVSLPGGNKKIILSDSSIVWLKGNSSILYSKEFGDKERNVKLTGEALFEVAKDPNRPFIIECGGLRARVLGTSFNIKSNEIDIEVFVLTGTVALSSEGNSEDLIVRPNEKAVYHAAGNQLAKVKAKEDERAARIAGTQYSMRFNATRMKEIITRVEGKFDVRVYLSDERLNNCTITADFTDQSLDRTLSLISQTLGIGYEIKGNQVTLKGRGCY